MARRSTPVDLGALLSGAESSLWRIEQQPTYRAAESAYRLDRYVAGNPIDPESVHAFVEWLNLVTEVSARGVEVVRVRVEEDPATDYQRHARWLGAWNAAAGEQLRYVDRADAPMTGAVGGSDWWIVDGAVLVELRFDQVGDLLGIEVEDAPGRCVDVLRCWDALVAASSPAPTTNQETIEDAPGAIGLAGSAGEPR